MRTVIADALLPSSESPLGRRASVIVEEDRIADVIRDDTPLPEDADRIDAGDRILIPGLVNAHTHSQGNLSKGVADRWTLELSLNAAAWTSGPRSTEQHYLSTVIGAADQLLRGCTTTFDMIYEFPAPTWEATQAVLQAYADIGMRAVVAPMVSDIRFHCAVPGLMDALPAELRERLESIRLRPTSSILDSLQDIFARWDQSSDMVVPGLGPTIPFLCSDEFLGGCRNLALEHGARLHTHLLESKVQSVIGARRFGRSLVDRLAAAGLLNERLTAAHAVWLDEVDRQRLADAGVAVAHNPGSNFRLGSGIADVRSMLDDGITVGIGTDGATCADSLNMFEAARLASFSSRVDGRPVECWLASAEVFRLATEGGAAACGMAGSVGRIEKGYKADLVLLDRGNINYLPLNHALNQVLNCENGGGVESVMVNGRWAVREGALVRLSLERLRARIEAAVEALRAATVPARQLAEEMAPIVAKHCHGLIDEPWPVHRYCGVTIPGQ